MGAYPLTRPLPCVHSHSGPILANGGPMLYLILRDLDPAHVGAYVDPKHMTVEGGLSGWEMGLDVRRPLARARRRKKPPLARGWP